MNTQMSTNHPANTTAATHVPVAPRQSVEQAAKAACYIASDVSAERSMLAVLMLSPAWIGRARQLFRPDHFSLKADRELFEAMLAVEWRSQNEAYDLSFGKESLRDSFRRVHGCDLSQRAMSLVDDLHHVASHHRDSLLSDVRNVRDRIVGCGQRRDAIERVRDLFCNLLDEQQRTSDILSRGQD